MMRRHAALDDCVPVPVIANLRVLFDKAAQKISSRISSSAWVIGLRRRGFASGLIALAPRRQKDDCRKQIVIFQRREKLRGGQLRHVELQRPPPLLSLQPLRSRRTSRSCLSLSINRTISGLSPPRSSSSGVSWPSG